MRGLTIAGLILGLAVPLWLWPSPAVRAEFLGKEECDRLKESLVKLELNGIRSDMQRGPEWARTNLEPARLREIQSLIDIDEKLMFRCRAARASKEVEAAIDAALKPPAPEPAAAGQPAAAGDPVAAPKPAVSAGKSEPKPPVKKVTKPKTEAKLKPKPKADDAYSPPPGTGSTVQAPVGVEPAAKPASPSPKADTQQ